MAIRLTILLVLSFSLVCCTYKLKWRPRELQTICLFIALSFVSEMVAAFMAWRFRNNLPVFHVFSPLLFLLVSVYFHRVSRIVRRLHLSYILAIIGLVASIANTVFLQPIMTFNSNYLLFAGLCTCLLGFITLYEFEVDDFRRSPASDPNFWITVSFLLQHVGTYFIYILIRFLKVSHSAPANLTIAYYVLWIVGVMGYLSIGLIYLIFPSKSLSHGRR